MAAKLKYMLIGATIGLVISILIVMTQHVLMRYSPRMFIVLVGPPLFLNRVTVNLGSMLNLFTFTYFMVLLSLCGYLHAIKMKRIHFTVILGLMVAVHIVLAVFGGRALFDDFFHGLRELPGLSLE
jgi:hypothetical protein